MNKNDTKLDMDLSWTNLSSYSSVRYGLFSSHALCFKGGHAELSNQVRIQVDRWYDGSLAESVNLLDSKNYEGSD